MEENRGGGGGGGKTREGGERRVGLPEGVIKSDVLDTGSRSLWVLIGGNKPEPDIHKHIFKDSSDEIRSFNVLLN